MQYFAKNPAVIAAAALAGAAIIMLAIDAVCTATGHAGLLHFLHFPHSTP